MEFVVRHGNIRIGYAGKLKVLVSVFGKANVCGSPDISRLSQFGTVRQCTEVRHNPAPECFRRIFACKQA